MNARELMTSKDLWVAGDTTVVRDVARLMAEHEVGAIPVLDAEGRLEGIVTSRDLVWRVLAAGRGMDTPVREIMTTGVQAVYPDAPLSEIESLMREKHVHRLTVIDDDDRLLGFITLGDLFRHIHGRRQERELVGVLEEMYRED